MHTACRLPVDVELRRLVEGPLVQHGQPDQVHRSQPLLQRSSVTSGRLFGCLEPDYGQAELGQHDHYLQLRQTM